MSVNKASKQKDCGGACYTPHNSTKGEQLPALMMWAGASKAKVWRGGIIPAQVGGGKRGIVALFSAGSRKRFMRKLAEIDRKAQPFFCTLTFPDDYKGYKSPLDWKRCLKRFLMAYRRRWGASGLVWRLELQVRKSGAHVGEVFPHYHLLVYGIDERSLQMFREWASLVWWRSCGCISNAHYKAGTNVVPTSGGSKLLVYVSKYMAKVDKNVIPAKLGRVWGVVEPEYIPFVRAIITQLEPKEAFDLIRYMRRYAGLRGRDYYSLTVFLDASYWFDNLARLLHPD